jgi:hypothetical protein
MSKAQIDAFMGASQVEDLSAVGRMNPTTIGPLDPNRIVIALRRPALHQVCALQ